MGVKAGPRIVQNGLILDVDAAVPRSYSGSGLTANGLVGGIGGTLVNNVGFGTTNYGSFIFDGTNDYADFSTYTPSANTINIWVKFNSLQYGPIVYVGNDSYASGVWSWSFFFTMTYFILELIQEILQIFMKFLRWEFG